jgi:hypothetical protein
VWIPRIAKCVTLGVGVSLGHDGSENDGGEAHVSADTKVIAFYGSLTPTPALFVDGLLAHGWLDFDTRRIDLTTGIETLGRRKGRYTAGRAVSR